MAPTAKQYASNIPGSMGQAFMTLPSRESSATWNAVTVKLHRTAAGKNMKAIWKSSHAVLVREND